MTLLDSAPRIAGRTARLLTDLAQVLESARDPEQRVEHALEVLKRLVPHQHCAFLLSHPIAGLLFTTRPRRPEPHEPSGPGQRERADVRAALDYLLDLLGDHVQPDGLAVRSAPPSPPLWQSHLAVPLIGLDRVLGVLAVGRDTPELYDDDDLALLSLVASQFGAYLAALDARQRERAETLEREQLLRAAAAERQRLQDATTALAAAGTVSEVIAAAVDAGRLALGAHRAWLAQRHADGPLAIVGSAGDFPGGGAEWEPVHAATPSPMAEAVRTASAVLLPSRRETLRRYPALTRVPSGDEATAAIPLVGTPGVLGVLGLGFDHVREWSASDTAFAAAFGRIAGQSLARAVAHEREHRTRAELEATLDAASDAILVVDAASRVLRLNRQALDLLAQPNPPPRTAADIKTVIARVRGETWPVRSLTIEQALNGEVVDQEFIWGAANQRLHARSAPIRDADGSVVGAVSIWRDITALHGAISERAALEGVRLTTRRVTHGMGNILQSLVVHAELAELGLVSENAGQPAVLEHLRAVQRDAGRIAELLRRLHSLNHVAPVDLGGQEMLELERDAGPLRSPG